MNSKPPNLSVYPGVPPDIDSETLPSDSPLHHVSVTYIKQYG